MCEISIIIPVYNRSEYIEETAKSILCQTFGDLELLLIDDGSTDGSGKICDEIAASDARVKVFHISNRGVSAARNTGIRNSKGKFISFVDADDRVDSRFLEKLHTAIVSADSDLAVCGYYEICNGKRTDRYPEKSDTKDAAYDVLRYNTLCVIWNKLFVRERIKHLFDENISTCEDSLFCVQYYLDNRPETAYVYEPLYGYIRHDDGLTGSLRKRSFSGINRFLENNMKIAHLIRDERLKRLAVHHVCRVYFYGVYMFIFQNVCNGAMSSDKLGIIAKVINNIRYRRIIKHILRYPLLDKKAERTSKTEFLYMLFSIFKMKRAVFFLAKVKKCLDSYRDRL